MKLSLAIALSLFGCAAPITNATTTDDDATEGDDPTAGSDGGTDATVGADGSSDPGGDGAPASAGMVTVHFTESTAALVNPERGFYVGYNLLDPSRAATVRAAGRTLALAQVMLDTYRDRPLDTGLLTALRAGFDAARAAGIKVILRFQYNSGVAADASKARILGHISQLSPLLHDHADVISVMQAGFIGAWGEWHSSTNGLDNDADRSEILTALLAAVPVFRSVQVRTPMFKAAAFPGGALTQPEAYSGSARARTGHHNDCFLASATDFGTYASPVATWETYVATDGQYTAIGGETCAVYEPRTNCTTAVATMASSHWSYLNSEYNQSVIAGWVAEGCKPDIDDRLGYRFVLDHVAHTEKVAPGGVLALQVAVRNEGFASLFNRRPVEIVLDNGSARHVVRLASIDARRWKAGELSSFTVQLRIPAAAAAGTYTLALRLPDESSTLSADPRYAIRLANDGVWSSATGDNALTHELVIDPAAPGPRDPGATVFVQL